MNQYGFVEISIVKNEQLFRAQLPLGVPWSDAKEALLEIAAEIDAHVKSIEEQQKAEAEKE